MGPRTPLLGKRGVAAHIDKKLRSILNCAQTGMSGANVSPIGRNQLILIRSTSDNWWLNQPTFTRFALSGSHSLRSCPSAPIKGGFATFYLWSRPPFLLPRRGIRLAQLKCKTRDVQAIARLASVHRLLHLLYCFGWMSLQPFQGSPCSISLTASKTKCENQDRDQTNN